MNKKQIAIEVLPRALWIIEGVILFFTSRKPILIDDTFIIILGIFVVLFGIVLLSTSFVYLAKPMFTKTLMTDGPYNYVRHPMYVSLYMVLVGLGMLFFSGVWFVVLLVFIPIWYLDCKIEERQMIFLCGYKYISYKRRVGMFFPRIVK